MNINKNISIWRGDSTPPTNYHFWIKSNGLLFTFNGEKWVNYVEDIPTASLESKGLMSSLDKVNLEECVLHLEDTSNPHHVSKELIGLSNVTNDAQVKRSEMGVANGVATLNESGQIPSTLLPSYVDDVLEFNNVSDFPAIGESGKIYVAISTEKTYRWSGTKYIEISKSIGLGETTTTAYAGDKGKANRDDIDKIKGTILSLINLTHATPTTVGIIYTDYVGELYGASGTSNELSIEAATTEKAGIMTANDKVEVNKIKDKADKVELKAVSDKVDTIIVPTKVSELTNDLAFQTKTEVNTAIQKVVGAAPEALDTLEEIATKLSDNDDAVAGIVNTLSDKANVGDSYTKTESDAKYLTTDAASDTYLPKLAYTAADILTKIKTVDGAGSGLDADMLDGAQGKDYVYYPAYNFENGCLVRLKLEHNHDYMLTVHIRGNSYSVRRPIDTWVQFYYYKTTGGLICTAALHIGYDFGNINVFCYDGHIYLWLKQKENFQSFSVYAECTNEYFVGNLVENITNAAMPTEGVTRLVTITPEQSALTTDLSNVLKEDVGSDLILEEIEYSTKEELKAELLGDVDSKLVTKVDKVEGKGLSTNDYTDKEKSKLSALPTSTELNDLLTYKQDIIVDSEDIKVGWDDEWTDRALYIKPNVKLKVFDDLWISAAGSFGTVDHTHTEDNVSKPYYLNEVWMTYEEALVVYNEKFARVDALIDRNISGVTNFVPLQNGSAMQFANLTAVNARVINVGNILAASMVGWLNNAPFVTNILGTINLYYWNSSYRSYNYLNCPFLTTINLQNLRYDFNIGKLKRISLASMQYMVNNSQATSSITVTVHPHVYAKLTGDTTNINPSTKITREVAVDNAIWNRYLVWFTFSCENLIFELFDTIIIPDIINPGTNEPIRGTVDIVDTTYKTIRVLIEKPAFDEEGELMFNTVPIGSKIMRVDQDTTEEELAQWQALLTTANGKNISFATPE